MARHLYDPWTPVHETGDSQPFKVLEEHSAKGPHRSVIKDYANESDGLKWRYVGSGIKNILRHACRASDGIEPEHLYLT